MHVVLLYVRKIFLLHVNHCFNYIHKYKYKQFSCVNYMHDCANLLHTTKLKPKQKQKIPAIKNSELTYTGANKQKLFNDYVL
jgi:hypothetical protein